MPAPCPSPRCTQWGSWPNWSPPDMIEWQMLLMPNAPHRFQADSHASPMEFLILTSFWYSHHPHMHSCSCNSWPQADANGWCSWCSNPVRILWQPNGIHGEPHQIQWEPYENPWGYLMKYHQIQSEPYGNLMGSMGNPIKSNENPVKIHGVIQWNSIKTNGIL